MNNTLNSDAALPKPEVPNVPKPSLKDFKIERPPLFPGFSELISREALAPAAVASPAVPLEPDSMTLSRAMSNLDPIEAETADEPIAGGRIDDAAEAAEVAAITRDQIRWDPRLAIMAQANSSPADVLAVLQ
jgi:hypothetical protein